MSANARTLSSIGTGRRAVPEPAAHAAQGIRRGWVGSGCGELACALADSSRVVCDGAAAHRSDRTEAGRGIPIFERGLIAQDRDGSDAGAVAGAQVCATSGLSALSGNSKTAAEMTAVSLSPFLNVVTYRAEFRGSFCSCVVKGEPLCATVRRHRGICRSGWARVRQHG